jgi:predicted peroxiredoxin
MGDYKNTPYLAKKDSKGKIRVWRAKIVSSYGDFTVFRKESGLFSGKKVTKDTTVFGKNKGRSNETTSTAQAIKEINSLYSKQLKKGYQPIHKLVKPAYRDQYTTLQVILNIIRAIEGADTDFNWMGKGEDAKLGVYVNLEGLLSDTLSSDLKDADGNFKPMLAKKFYKKTKNGLVPSLKFPCLVQPKINGVRCMAKITLDFSSTDKFIDIKLLSKNGLEYNIPHIKEDLKSLLKKYLDCNKSDLVLSLSHSCDKDFKYTLYLDGEIYIHGEILSEIASLVKKQQLLSTTLTYQVFDVGVKKSQIVRLDFLDKLLPTGFYYSIHKVATRIAKSAAIVSYMADVFIDQGYEGAICRTMDNIYQFGKRVSTMVKVKKTEDKEFKIVDVIDSRDNPGVGIFVCQNDLTNDTFKVNPEATVEQKREYFKNSDKYIGKLLTVRFFERTVNKKPFHAKGIAVRDYE